MIVMSPLFSLYLYIASYTNLSFFLSRAEVASSNKSILGFFKNALAIAILYFYPPESYDPADPTYVLIPVFPNLVWIKLQAFAATKASTISSSVAFGLARRRFSSIDVLNKTGS